MTKVAAIISKEDLPPLAFPVQSKVEMLSRIALGGCAEIFLCEIDGETKAVRALSCDNDDAKEMIKTSQRGMRNVLKVSSDGLIKASFDYYVEYKDKDKEETRLLYCQIMPYIEGLNLYQYLLQENEKMSSIECYEIALKIAKILCDLHQHENEAGKAEPLIHCDLALRNILIQKNTTINVYICDFDFTIAESKQTHSKEDSDRLFHLCTSPPEHYKDQPRFTTDSDIYGLGAIFYSLYMKCTRDFFDGGRVEKDQLSSDEFSNLIKKCVDNDSTKRPSAIQVVECLEGIMRSELKKSTASEKSKLSPEAKEQEPEFLQAPGTPQKSEEPQASLTEEVSYYKVFSAAFEYLPCMSLFASKEQKPAIVETSSLTP